MAKAKAGSTQARALSDINIEGVEAKCGKTFTASPDLIAALVESGQADDTPEAIAAGNQE